MGFLRKIFGPDREEIWRELSRQIGAEYVEEGFWKGDKVRAHVGEWTITLDVFVVSSGNSSTTYTRMRAPYVNRDGFQFAIYRTSVFSGIGKFFGMQDIEVGHAIFDEDFIIKANDESKVRALLANARIREPGTTRRSTSTSRTTRGGLAPISRRAWTSCTSRWWASSRISIGSSPCTSCSP